MKKKTLSIALALVMLLSAAAFLASCGETEDEMARPMLQAEASGTNALGLAPRETTSPTAYVTQAPRETTPPTAYVTQFPRETELPTLTQQPPTLPPTTLPPFTPPPVTEVPVTIIPGDSPPRQPTVRHHMPFSLECWCGLQHIGGMRDDPHTELCYCEVGTPISDNDKCHITYRQAVCWCGWVHNPRGADRPHTGEGGGKPCNCWDYDSKSNPNFVANRHHIIDGRTCWCGLRHERRSGQHSEYYCHCVLDYGMPANYAEKCHITSRQACWCGWVHNPQGADYPHTQEGSGPCNCWEHDTATIGVVS